MPEVGPRMIESDPKGARAPGDPGDVAFIAGVLRRQRPLIAAMAALGLVAGTLIYLFVPPTFRSTAVVLIDFKRLAAVDENYTTDSGRIDSSMVLSQLELLTSESVIRRVVISEKLDNDPEFNGDGGTIAGYLGELGLISASPGLTAEEKRLHAIAAVRKAVVGSRVDLSYTISIIFTAHDGAKAARIANGIAQAYIDDQLDAKRESSDKASQWFSARIAELQSDVSQAENKTIEFRLKKNIATADGKFVDETQLSELGNSVLTASFVRSGARAKVEQLKKVIEAGATDSALADEFSNQVIIELRGKLLDARRRDSELTAKYGANHQAVRQVREDIQDIQSAIDDEFKRISAAANSDLAIATVHVATLESEFNELSKKVNNARAARAELAHLESVADAVKTIRDTFMSRYVDGIQKQSFPMTEARIISAADTPLTPSFPTPFKALGGGALLGFGAGFILSVIREAFTRRIRFGRQVREISEGEFLGYLPSVGAGRPVKACSAAEMKTLPVVYVETLRNIKIHLDLERKGQTKVLTFLSCVPGEGTTVTASNFAQMCAAAGWRTLLVDLNLRNQDLSRRLVRDRKLGLADVVAGKATVEEAIFTDPASKLHILPGCGPTLPENPHDLLSSARTRDVMAELSRDYDYIVLDLPALGAAPDAEAISLITDRFVFLVEWNKTETHVLGEIMRNNKLVRDKLLGVAMTKAVVRKLLDLGELNKLNVAGYRD